MDPVARTDAGEVWRRRSGVRRVGVPLFLAVVIAGVVMASGCMERLFYYPQSGPTPLPGGFPGAEAMSFRSADGTRLHGWFLPAIGVPARDAATVLHVHGNAGNIVSHLYFTGHLPAAGFNLVLFDYRGYGQSEGTARRREDLIADTAAALDAMLARADVDPDRIGMYAQSLGGAIGLNVMGERDEIRAAVVDSAFASWRDVAACAIGHSDEPIPALRFVAGLMIRDHRRPLDAIGVIDRPILIVHGDRDTTVPVSEGRRLAAAAANARLVELKGGGHNTLRETHPEIDGMVTSFFREHLGPGAGRGS